MSSPHITTALEYEVVILARRGQRTAVIRPSELTNLIGRVASSPTNVVQVEQLVLDESDVQSIGRWARQRGLR